MLLALLAAVQQPAKIFVDARLNLPDALPGFVEVVAVQPTLRGRLAGERQLARECGADDVLLCFGNLPPLFRNSARVFVYLQNRYLTSRRNLSGLAWRTRARILAERLWLRICLRDAEIVVQTASMADEVRETLGRPAIVAPFAPKAEPSKVAKLAKEFDFLYVASGEAHKNHRRLVQAWKLLAEEGHYPSLRLTLNATRDRELFDWVAEQASSHKLNISNGDVSYDQVSLLYDRSAALIHVSLFESFGLPLIEAQNSGLPIIAAERDYVRDVSNPAQTFDPESPRSISRAILRHLRHGDGTVHVMSANEFLSNILDGQ